MLKGPSPGIKYLSMNMSHGQEVKGLVQEVRGGGHLGGGSIPVPPAVVPVRLFLTLVL